MSPSIGRNEPCPCKSGKKYKKCCQTRESNQQATEFFWYRLRESRNSLIKKILSYINQKYGDEAIQAAWEDFYLEEDQIFDADSLELQLFMPWFFYSWCPAEDYPWRGGFTPTALCPAKSLIGSSQVQRLDLLQQQYLEKCLLEPFSFFEILEVTPGKGFKIEDVFRGQKLDVVEKSASQAAKAGSLLFGKPVTIQGLTTLEACSSIFFSPAEKISLIHLRRQLEKEYSTITSEILFKHERDLLDHYQALYKKLVYPEMPKLTNTDGEPLLPQRLIFNIDSPEDVFEALHDLCFQETRDTLLEDAKFTPNGELLAIDFPWLKKEKGQKKVAAPTVLGHLSVKDAKLIVQVNSMERAEKFKKILKDRKLNHIIYKTSLIEPVESHLNKLWEKRDAAGGEREHPSSEKNLLMENPEVQEKLAEIMQSHYAQWIDEKIPALQNKTPREASKIKEGREMIEALLLDFEQRTETHPQPGVSRETFQRIREKLGMD